MSEFEAKVKEAAERAVLKILMEGSWITPDYNSRFKIPTDMLADVWKMVDVEAVKRRMAIRLQEELADRVVNHMAAEIATDVKQILSVQERREALRAVVRENLDRITKA